MSICVDGRVVCRSEVNSLPTRTRHGHRQLPEVVWTQFVSPDDEHYVLETCRVKNINKYIQDIVRHVGHLPRIIITMPLIAEYNKRFRKRKIRGVIDK